ncbi:permease YjgP/YjgQ family [alpha proteobacterium HIMB5]|nr:permease YjgP/YjgQ family [alpha proteobacterium HIMB5]
MIKVYKKYLILNFITIFFKILAVFTSLGFIMGILEEINFFSEIEINFYFPIILVLLNLPSLLYEIFPFIFLLTSQFFFINLLDKGELITLKKNGLNNLKILNLISITSFIIGMVIIILFYNFSAVLKFKYIDLKKNYTKDNKYLATITENGLWIKDQIGNKINFINSNQFSTNTLIDVDIIQLDQNFNFERNIKAEEVDIRKKLWKLKNSYIIKSNNDVSFKNEIYFQTNFNFQEINKLFSNLSSLTIWKLYELKENYKTVNYSTTEIDYHLQKIISYPFLITVMTILTSILMLNIRHQKPKILIIVIGILLSVSIYYINFFFGAMGKNEKVPLMIAVWTPILILSLISLIGLVRINEK